MKSANDQDSLVPTPRLSESEWRDLRKLVHQTVGIKLSEAKRVFLMSRLLKRLRATGTQTFREYFRLLKGSPAFSGEHQQFINAVTTNKTDFFREPEHFVVLERWLREPSPMLRAARQNGLRIWCAAASTGEEPYSIAATLRECLTDDEFRRARLVASDIDTSVLDFARQGVYNKGAIEPVCAQLRKKMFVAGAGEFRERFRVRRELREKVHFVQENLVKEPWKVGTTFDLIFCRNVLIYFERATQQTVVSRMLGHLEPHGLLFLGHSESLNSLSLSARYVAHSVYAPAQRATLRPTSRLLLSEPRLDSHPPGGSAYGPRASRAPSRFPSARPRGRTAPPGSLARSIVTTAEVLRVGECRLESSQWLWATLKHSVLVVVYSVKRQAAMVCHENASGTREVLPPVRDSIESMVGALKLDDPDCGELHAKIVSVNEAEAAELKCGLTQLGVVVTKIRVVPGNASVWIEPNSDRILLGRDKPR